MLSAWINHSIVGQGFLNLFVSLLLLTIICVVLLVISRKWMLPTRSFLLLGMIASYVTLIALNLFFLQTTGLFLISLPQFAVMLVLGLGSSWFGAVLAINYLNLN